jgi:hypothetical protein
MCKSSFEVFGRYNKDTTPSSETHFAIIADNPQDVRKIVDKKYPHFVITLIYPSKYNIS